MIVKFNFGGSTPTLQQNPTPPTDDQVLQINRGYTSNFADDDDWQTELAKSKSNKELLTDDARILDAGNRIFSTRGFNFQQGFDNKFQRDYVAARLRKRFGLNDKKVKLIMQDPQFIQGFLKDNSDQMNWQEQNRDNQSYYGTMGSSYYNYAAKQKAELEAKRQAEEAQALAQKTAEDKKQYLNERQGIYNKASDLYRKDKPLSTQWQNLNKQWANTNYFDDYNNDGVIDVNEIKAFQSSVGLIPDGKIGEKTIAALRDRYLDWAQQTHEDRVGKGLAQSQSADPIDWGQTQNYQKLLQYNPPTFHSGRRTRRK